MRTAGRGIPACRLIKFLLALRTPDACFDIEFYVRLEFHGIIERSSSDDLHIDGVQSPGTVRIAPGDYTEN